MQITIDPLTLTQAQREHVAGFLMTFPTRANSGPFTAELKPEPNELTEQLKASLDIDEAAAAFAQPTALFPGSATLDKDGLPWDERIHAGTKVFTAEGNWRKRRGVADDLVATVEAELRKVLAIPAPPQAAVSAVIPNAVATGPEALTITIPPPPPAEVDPKVAFTALVNRASTAVRDKKITMDELNALATEIGLPEFRHLATRLDLVPQLSERLDLLLMTR